MDDNLEWVECLGEEEKCDLYRCHKRLEVAAQIVLMVDKSKEFDK